MSEFTDKASLEAFNDGVIAEFRANQGRVGGPFEGATLLLLTTTGAKSGQSRLTPLVYLDIDGRIIIVGSKAGSDTNPHWVHNLRAHPQARIEIGSDGGIDTHDVTARELPPADRDAVFAKVVAAAPGFGDYQANTRRVIPLFELQRT